MHLRFRILGPLEVEHAGDPVVVPGAQQRALLALLLVHANQRLSADRLADELWGEPMPPRAVKRLQVMVTRLRRALEPQSADELLTVPGGYLLTVKPGALDTEVFEAGVAEGRQALGDGAPERAAECLSEALRCWRGPALDEFAYATWAQPEIRRLDELRLVAHGARADAELRCGRHAALISELEPLVNEHPTHERLAGHLLLALYRCGRQADALAAYQRIRTQFVNELGLEPGPALQTLQREILEQSPSLQPRTAPAPPPDSGARSDFVGRENVMAVLERSCREALRGRTTIVALSGEPGIGKTRCAEEILGRARSQGALTGWGLCAEDSEAPAYWPWRQLSRKLLEVSNGPGDALAGAQDVQRLIDGHARTAADGESADENRFHLHDSVAAFLAALARKRPLALAVEDLHWSDPSSLTLLLHVARVLRNDRLLVVVTHRTLGRAGDERLRELVDRVVAAPGVIGLEIDGLDVADVATYVELVTGRAGPPGAAAALHHRTRGNPLFVAELVRLLETEGKIDGGLPAGVPSGLRAVLRQRARALPPRTQALLAVGAVAGTQFALPAVASAAGLERADALADLEPALDDQLVVPAGNHRYRFSHAIARDVLYEDQAAAARGAQHAALVAVLAARRERGAEQPVAEIAHHAISAARAGLDASSALEWSRQAADEAMRLLAYAEAAGHLERALEAADLGDLLSGAERLTLTLELAGALTAAGDVETAQARFVQAAELARRLGDIDAMASAALGYAAFQLYGVIDHVAIDLLEEARRLLPSGDSALRAQITGRLSVRLDPAAQQDYREALLLDAIAMARRIGEPRALSRLLALSPLVHWRARSGDRRRSDALETIALAQAGGDREAALWAHIVLHTDLFAAGDLAAADAELAAYSRLAAQLRQHYYRWYGIVMRATRATFDGRLEEGRRLAAEAIAINRERDTDSEQEWVVQQLLHNRVVGNPDDVPLEGLRTFAERYDGKPLWRALLAVGQCTARDLEAAAATLETCARAGLDALPVDVDRVCTLALLADVCAAVGDVERAGALYPLLEPYANRNVLTDRSWAAWGPAARPLGLLAAMMGERERALEHFQLAIALCRRWGARPWLLHAIHDQASALPASPGTAALAREGVTIARAIGLPSLEAPLAALADLA